MAKFLGGSRVVRFLHTTVWIVGLCLAGLRMGAADVSEDCAGAVKRLEVLRTEIARHDELYFKKAAPEISDEAYDRLKRELVELETRLQTEEETSGGKGMSAERLGDDRSGRFPTRRHGERMMSLEKVYAEKELRAFLKRVEAAVREAKGAGGEGFEKVSWVVEPKYDGLAISATYERGRLVRVVTRGDGIEGDDVTANALMIRALPETLKGPAWPERIEVRGEVFAGFAEFERVNEERAAAGEALFANPRALAAGSLKLGDPAEVRARGLSVVFYGWGEVRPGSARAATQSGFHEQVRAWGLPGAAEAKRVKTVEEVCAVVRAFSRRRTELAFPTDGVVIKLDVVAQQERLGATQHAPRWAVAYKFSTERVVTRVTGITVQVGRSGVLTPVAELEPVRLGGSVVARATLHNAEEIARLDVCVGDEVWVEKAGEIIPAVVGVNKARRDTANGGGMKAFSFPEDCPVCGAAVVTRTDEGVRQYCANRECPAQVAARLMHFTGVHGVAIRGLGEATVAALIEKRGARTPADIYRFTRDDWRTLPGLGKKTADKLFAAVEASKQAELWRFVNGLGVTGTGVATSRILARRFGSLEELAAASEAELTRIEGVGVKQADALAAFFEDPENRRLITELRACGVEPRRMMAGEARRKGPLAGKVFALTGTLPTLTRAQAEERIEAAGGVVAGMVTVKTDFVVAGVDAGEKRRRADELGVRIIDEAELLRRLADGVTDQ